MLSTKIRNHYHDFNIFAPVIRNAPLLIGSRPGPTDKFHVCWWDGHVAINWINFTLYVVQVAFTIESYLKIYLRAWWIPIVSLFHTNRVKNERRWIEPSSFCTPTVIMYHLIESSSVKVREWLTLCTSTVI